MRHTAHGARRRTDGGFTLLEIVVSLAVVGLLFGVVISRMDTMFDWEMKATSNRLASTIRYLYNKAASEGLYVRLVIDLDEQTYWVEATSDPFTLATGEEAEKAKRQEEEQQAKGTAPAALEAPALPEARAGKAAIAPLVEPEPIKPHEPTFSPVESALLKPTKLPDSVFFKDVQVEHRATPAEGGKESIYFFPNGLMEHAVVNLRDEADETHYSLETNPVSGRVTIENDYRMLGGQKP
jgi:prepilin-type N-terminal cleavage/methylation domain-containing protein